jgi:hypothetical protein
MNHVSTEIMSLNATACDTITLDIVTSDAIASDTINSGIITGGTTVTIIVLGEAIDNSTHGDLWALSRLLPHGRGGL